MKKKPWIWYTVAVLWILSMAEVAIAYIWEVDDKNMYSLKVCLTITIIAFLCFYLEVALGRIKLVEKDGDETDI